MALTLPAVPPPPQHPRVWTREHGRAKAGTQTGGDKLGRQRGSASTTRAAATATSPANERRLSGWKRDGGFSSPEILSSLLPLVQFLFRRSPSTSEWNNIGRSIKRFPPPASVPPFLPRLSLPPFFFSFLSLFRKFQFQQVSPRSDKVRKKEKKRERSSKKDSAFSLAASGPTLPL